MQRYNHMDSETGLYYYGARWYDPITGRWLSNDPIGISGGLNQYVFVDNNPINLRDPWGLCTKLSADIEMQKRTLEKLQRMMAYWEPGQTFRYYGLGVEAESWSGYRSPEFYKRSKVYQDVVNQMERNWRLSLGFGIGRATIGAVGYWTLDLHGLIHGTSAREQIYMYEISIGMARNLWILRQLEIQQPECR